ncbi:MAG: protein phosphatase 2C domain-containing protein [Aureliella sp.]
MPVNEHDSFCISGASDIGKQRFENQDHFLVASLRRQLVVEQTDVSQSLHDELFGCQEGKLLVVADGMGGHSGGEIASRTAIEASARYVLDMMQWFLKLSPNNEQEFENELSDCLTTIQEQIWVRGGKHERQMGTTVTMAYLLWPRMFVIHAGDSRCYLLRDNELIQLTTDHTIAQQLIDSGGLAADDAAVAHWRHVLWNCVGGDRQVRPEALRCPLKPNDIVILCSDGLTGMIDDSQIVSIVKSSNTSKQATARLIDAANSAGGHDNVTAIVCRIGRPDHCDESSGADSARFTGNTRDTL